MRARMELVAPDERPWNEALSICLAACRDGPVICRERLGVSSCILMGTGWSGIAFF